MAKYEYKVLEDGYSPHSHNSRQNSLFQYMQERLNKLGLEGWKVVGTGGGGAGNSRDGDRLNGWVILMRELE